MCVMCVTYCVQLAADVFLLRNNTECVIGVERESKASFYLSGGGGGVVQLITLSLPTQVEV
jgi:hypothetical protein